MQTFALIALLRIMGAWIDGTSGIPLSPLDIGTVASEPWNAARVSASGIFKDERISGPKTIHKDLPPPPHPPLLKRFNH